jgi:KTSC domain
MSSIGKLATIVLSALPFLAQAGEVVNVKYRGPVDLAHFECEFTPKSTVVNRLCYDKSEQYVVVELTGTYYHYCEIPPSTVSSWRSAESLGKFFYANVKGNFDCRTHRVPPYSR